MNYATRFFIIIIFLATFRVASATSDNDSRTMRLFDNPEIVSPKYNSFCLDSRGYLWIGSETGLVRFDGINYETFRHDDKIPGSISTNRISKIMCDSRGDIWVATADGLNLYDQKSNSFREVTLPGVGLKGYIMDLTEQSDGSIAFIVAGVGIYVVDNKDENRGSGVVPWQGANHNIRLTRYVI